MPRKRSSAFEDFPVEPSSGSQPEPRPASSLFKPPDPGEHVLAQPKEAQVERIERLHPSQMLPDRFQPRRLLPAALRAPFFSGQIDCYTAAQRWLALAKNDPAMQEMIDRLLAMGSSFAEHGQIKPITGSWVAGPGGGYIFQIETGERRFWAACLQREINKEREEPLLRVEVIAQPTRMRQVLENRHAEPPSAVGRACEVASLILAELDVQPTGAEADEFDYFRQAIDRRMKAGLWDKILPVMQVSRPQVEHLLAILRLPTPLLEVADRARVSERVLREVLRAPEGQWPGLVQAAVRSRLTSDEVASLAAYEDDSDRPARGEQPRKERAPAAAPDPVQQAINAMKRFVFAYDQLDEETRRAVLDELANDFVVRGRGDTLAAAAAELARLVQIRQQARRRR